MTPLSPLGLNPAQTASVDVLRNPRVGSGQGHCETIWQYRASCFTSNNSKQLSNRCLQHLCPQICGNHLPIHNSLTSTVKPMKKIATKGKRSTWTASGNQKHVSHIRNYAWQQNVYHLQTTLSFIPYPFLPPCSHVGEVRESRIISGEARAPAQTPALNRQMAVWRCYKSKDQTIPANQLPSQRAGEPNSQRTREPNSQRASEPNSQRAKHSAREPAGRPRAKCCHESVLETTDVRNWQIFINSPPRLRS